MPRKPHTTADLPDDLSARREWLAKSAGLLRRASTSLAKVPALSRGNNLAQLIRWAEQRQRHTQAALASLRKAEQLLANDLEAVRGAVRLIERDLGERRGPGRPKEFGQKELSDARHWRRCGYSWEKTLRLLNEQRPKRAQIPLSTLRTAVNPRRRTPPKGRKGGAKTTPRSSRRR